MAGIDIRTTFPPPALPQGRAPSERVQAAREAQRAFFNAALAGEAAGPSTTPVASPPPVAPSAVVKPGSPLRPGSLVDIKV